MTSTDKSHTTKVNDEAPTYTLKCFVHINLFLNVFKIAFVHNLIINTPIAIKYLFS